MAKSIKYKRFVIVANGLKSGYEEHDSVGPICSYLQRRAADRRNGSLKGEKCWINIEGICDTEMELLGTVANLHDITRKDCILEDTTISDEKWETIGEYLFVITDILRNDRNDNLICPVADTSSSKLEQIKSTSLESAVKRDRGNTYSDSGELLLLLLHLHTSRGIIIRDRLLAARNLFRLRTDNKQETSQYAKVAY
jgi:Mg2+ and Co2+ transporter CorA